MCVNKHTGIVLEKTVALHEKNISCDEGESWLAYDVESVGVVMKECWEKIVTFFFLSPFYYFFVLLRLRRAPLSHVMRATSLLHLRASDFESLERR